MTPEEIVIYVVLGLVGAAARIALHIRHYGMASIKWDRAASDLFLGMVAGYICHYLVATLQVTNHLTALGFGYMGPSVVEHLLKRPLSEVEPEK